jgi:hypothetical protein
MKQINPNISPHDGYFFRDHDGSTHHAQSWNGVIARVAAYRKRQGKPTDSVAKEVTEQACARNPVLCVEDNGATRAAVQKASLKTRVLQWLLRKKNEREKQELHFIPADLHAARTDVCIRCPCDKSLPGNSCGSCKAALQEMKEAVVGNRATDARITACPFLGEHLPVSTWLDEPAVLNPDLPPECWRKRTI